MSAPTLPDADFDLVVVGGGPAGLTAAHVAAQAGLRVVVLERGSAFGELVRTSGGSFTKPLRELGIPDHCWHPVSRLRLQGPRHDLSFDYPDDPICIIDIRTCYQWMAQRAAAAGAELRLRTRVTGALVEDGRVVGVTLRGATPLRARLVLDASGGGVVARSAGLRAAPPRQAVGLEVELSAPSYDQREALLVVGSHVAPGGYGWAFPRGDARVRLGVGVVRPDSEADIEELMDRFSHAVPSLRDSCVDAQPLEVHSGVMPAFPYGTVPLLFPGLVLAGDAAGQGSTFLGEGIRHVILAGSLAARHIVAALTLPPGTPTRRRDELLAAYPGDWDALVGWEMRVGFRVHEKVCRYDDPEWSQALDLVARLHPDLVLEALMGRLTPGFARRLLSRQPALALGAGRRLALAAARTR